MTKKYEPKIVALMLFFLMFYPSLIFSQNNNNNGTIRWEYYPGTEKDIRDYYNDNFEELDPVEGVFTLSYKIFNSYGSLVVQKDNWQTLAIIKDVNSLTREFIEICLSTDDFPKYAITAEFTKATNGIMYLSKQFGPEGKTSNENFVWDQELGMLTSKTIFYNKGNKFTMERYYLKTFPKSVSTDVPKIVRKSMGTCFAISKDGFFVTNHHVIKNGGDISIFLKENLEEKVFKANVVFKDEKNDLALLKIADSNFYFESIPYRVDENSRIGESVFTLGFPMSNIMGGNLKYTDGSISALSGVRDDERYYQISVPIQPGNSGGPLFNKNGDVVGIITAKLNSQAVGVDVQNVNYAIKAAYLSQMMEMIHIKPDIILPAISKGPNFEKYSIEALSKFIGIVVSEN